MDKRPNFKEIEEKWQKFWNNEGQYLFRFDINKNSKTYVIDTPPPFTSGDAHMGHALNWVWMDFVSRFKRLEGYNVYLPQGWDCHGLPTELKVEKKMGIPKEDVERFLEGCRQWTLRSIESMKKTFIRLGFVPDWSKEYRTMDPKYKAFVQYTLIKMFNEGLIYRDKHPVLWCPNCRTAVSAQEVGYIKKKGKFVYIKLPILNENKHLLIATTRPEMISACVAVLISDKGEYVETSNGLIVSKRYAEDSGLDIIKTIKPEELAKYKVVIPLINREVEIRTDPDVEYDFGTGIVWVCTYGDETDIKWQKKYNLPVYQCIDENGKIVNSIPEINGLSVSEAKERIIELLDRNGNIYKIEEIEHNVLSHVERSDCMSPIELIPKEQFFLKTLEFKDKLLELQKQVRFYPEWMRYRLMDWINSLSWDWNLSRTRVWGLAFPFIKTKQGIIPIDIEDLPFDPRTDKEKLEKYRQKYGEIEVFNEVLDVWIESSITPLAILYYAITENKEIDPKEIPEVFEKIKERIPVNLRPQGYEIIRTWMFDTLLRVWLLTNKVPWRDALINGMVLAEDGRKMSKSLGNAVDPNEVMDKYSADALRYWALMASQGNDYRFMWKDIETGQSYLIKIWNLARYIYMNTNDIDLNNIPELKSEDKEFLNELKELSIALKEYGDNYKFQEYMKTLRKFVWSKFANGYLEKVKNRIKEGDLAAKWTIKYALRVVLSYLHPAFPHLTEEIYNIIYAKNENKKSLLETPFDKIEGLLKSLN